MLGVFRSLVVEVGPCKYRSLRVVFGDLIKDVFSLVPSIFEALLLLVSQCIRSCNMITGHVLKEWWIPEADDIWLPAFFCRLPVMEFQDNGLKLLRSPPHYHDQSDLLNYTLARVCVCLCVKELHGLGSQSCIHYFYKGQQWSQVNTYMLYGSIG